MTIGAHRKVVTALFCDVVGSTALGESIDPEALQRLLARYFERMQAIVESHGGSVEKFIGDAVMAVFGVPMAHEDDALRACRAAIEMREALPELGVSGRIGINTGEVLTGTEERLAAGDAVNVAARLERAAKPGEVLISAETLGLVGSAVEVGEERLLELKGKGVSVAVHSLLEVREAGERPHASVFVGRARELEQLSEAWARALAGPRCELVTVVGDPGVGKSRLVAEALELMDARVVRGRCLSYGEGITYWPVVEVLKQLATVPTDEFAAQAIRSLFGESDVSSGTDEIAWAFRKLLEEQAPLVVSFDDIQWGEDTFLDLVESTALLSTGAPLLLLCMARPELLDRRPGWPGTVRLEPLPTEEAAELVGEVVPDEARERIIHAAGGNPLFLTEMVALTRERGGGEVEVPPTLRALVAARLDQLEAAERRVLERGAVEGELFHRGTVQALAPEETEITPRLAALVRKELVRPDRPQLPHEDAYRFRHLLIRDAAYDALPKSTRADLHRRFAAWLGEHGASLVELDEILGYHLDRAVRYLEELGLDDPELALAAGDRLRVAGTRALRRGDLRAGAALAERSLELTRPLRLDVHLEVELASSFQFADPSRALEIVEAVASRAETDGNEEATALAKVCLGEIRLTTGEVSADELERLARAALPLLEDAGDREGLLRVWLALSVVANMRSRYEEWAETTMRAIRYARERGPDSRTWGLGVALAEGPRRADDALSAFDRLLPAQPNPIDLVLRGVLLAMLDRTQEAWAVALPAAERARELGWEVIDTFLGRLAEAAGDDASAAAYLRSACDLYEARGSTSVLSTYAPLLGRLLCSLGRHEEAELLAVKGRELGASNDVLTQTLWRQTESLLQSHCGEHAAAENVAREAVTWAQQGDSLQIQGDSFSVLAEVLDAAGKRGEAAAALEQALDCYERKQIIPLARRVRERLAEIQPT